jgi:ABC-type multidrug transport system ATPase subunit
MRLNGVAFRYARRGPWVLRDVSLDLGPGRIIEFSGANGAGKSTLLRLIAGILRPRSGAADGRPTRVAYAPERFPGDQPFTVAAYLGFMARMRRLPDTAAAPWIERFGLTTLLDIPLPDLSKGSAQKVGLVQALSAGAGLLVLDEPFAGLDTQTRSKLPGVLTELAASGTTVVVSDHQGCLDDLPGVDRHRIENHSVSGPLPGARTQRPAAGHVTLEVLVAPDEAEAVAAKLRADGHRVRWVPR